jgi:hypothetical protein
MYLGTVEGIVRTVEGRQMTTPFRMSQFGIRHAAGATQSGKITLLR